MKTKNLFIYIIIIFMIIPVLMFLWAFNIIDDMFTLKLSSAILLLCTGLCLLLLYFDLND